MRIFDIPNAATGATLWEALGCENGLLGQVTRANPSLVVLPHETNNLRGKKPGHRCDYTQRPQGVANPIDRGIFVSGLRMYFSHAVAKERLLLRLDIFLVISPFAVMFSSSPERQDWTNCSGFRL